MSLQETELVVCSTELKRNHRELFHYTKLGGLQGILTDDTLRASHFEDMNDKREVWLLKERLIPALAPRFERLAEGLNLYRRVMFMKGGRGAGGARPMFDALYGATFASKRGAFKIAAFMTSFSTHSSDGDFERENGLWGQWDQYAGLDGYCIVFDTAAICDLLAAEFDDAYWVRLAVEPVRYSAPDVPVDALMPELMSAGEDVFRQFLEGVDLQEFAVPQFLMGATLLKDADWCEEREVRIVAITNLRFTEVVSFSGVLKMRRTIVEVSFEMPRRIKSRELCAAWIVWNLDRSAGTLFVPAREVAWVIDGRKSKDLLPWRIDRAERESELKAYRARPAK